jgi:hypothetical protein
MDNSADLMYFFTPSPGSGLEFVVEFTRLYEEMPKYVNFTPYYVLWSDPVAQKSNWTITNPNCTSSGRFCAPDPGTPSFGLSNTRDN